MDESTGQSHKDKKAFKCNNEQKTTQRKEKCRDKASTGTTWAEEKLISRIEQETGRRMRNDVLQVVVRSRVSNGNFLVVFRSRGAVGHSRGVVQSV